MHRNQLAKEICEALEKCTKPVSTKAIQLTHEINQGRALKILDLLKQMGIVRRFYGRPAQWKLSGMLYDRDNPLETEISPGAKVEVDDSKISDIEDRFAKEVKNLTQEIAALKANQAQVNVIEVKAGSKTQRREIKGAVHPIFKQVLQLAMTRKNIFLPGPTGCGKSHLAKQLADALEDDEGNAFEFDCISCIEGLPPAALIGRKALNRDGGMVYQSTPFVDRYEKGGVFLFDEIDASDSNTLLVVNSALANGYMSLPDRDDNPRAKKHANFICIAAANTFGRGADRVYVGRNQLDEATLDRFRIGTVPMDYDRSLETKLCPDDILRNRLEGYRQQIARNRLERFVSTRFMIDAYDMTTTQGWSLERVDEALFSGWSDDEISRVKVKR